MGQSLRKVHTCRLFTGTSSRAGETRLSSLLPLLLRGVALWSDLFSLSPPSLSIPSLPLPPPSPCHTRSSPEGICIPGRYWPPIGQVRAGRPQGSPTNGDGGCMTHRERTSCSTTLLLFLLRTAAIALSFLFFFFFLTLHLLLLFFAPPL